MCAIVGLLGKDEISYEVIDGLMTLQHRGQDAAGIVTFDRRFNVQKGLGLINQVFKRSQIKDLKGALGLGHLRYATQGNNEILNAQPFVINYPYGLAMAHNGNVTNYSSLRKSLYDEFHCLLETSSDLELILYTFACELIKSDLRNITVEEIFRSVEATQRKIKGAYTTLGIIANHGLLAFADPYGIRPLVMGAKEDKDGMRYAFASESSCFDYLCYDTIQDIHPGEAIFIDMNHKIHKKTCYQKGCAFCIFEYIYFAREDSVLHGRLVASERLKMGKQLAKSVVQAGLKPDLVIDVPVSAYFFAAGLAEELDVPYRRGLAKNNHVGRSFISPFSKS